MNRFLATWLVALAPMLAWAATFPIDVTPNLNGLNVTYETTALTYNSGAMALYNRGNTPVACKAVFTNGPDTPRVRQVRLEAGKSATLAGNFLSQIIRLRIELTCTPG